MNYSWQLANHFQSTILHLHFLSECASISLSVQLAQSCTRKSLCFATKQNFQQQYSSGFPSLFYDSTHFGKCLKFVLKELGGVPFSSGHRIPRLWLSLKTLFMCLTKWYRWCSEKGRLGCFKSYKLGRFVLTSTYSMPWTIKLTSLSLSFFICKAT